MNVKHEYREMNAVLVIEKKDYLANAIEYLLHNCFLLLDQYKVSKNSIL